MKSITSGVTGKKSTLPSGAAMKPSMVVPTW
jgi:hypothetical protein